MMKFIKGLHLFQWVMMFLIILTLLLAAILQSVEPLFFTIGFGFIVYWEELLKGCENIPMSDNSSPTDFMS